ncbi:M13 family metallopeptidase [Prevotella sp. HJM029]|uniref:M13 family metallopeptidase n=1 Tax=Prevotella sp. HJM029 TaxID=1433844 RepID=UPI00048E2DCC|nr:M13 family metallopeptidase [Prevotella sp. HJM029]
MKMKKIIPMVMMATLPTVGMAQDGSGLFEKNFDHSVKPQDDFYQFATGGWQKNNPLPAAYSRFGSFDQLQENNNKRINTILSELQKGKFKTGTIEQKLSDFYKLALDVERRNKEGIAPVKGVLDEIEAAKTISDLRKLQLKYAVQGYGVQYGAAFAADEKDVKNNIFNIYQSGLTLGQKDYYLNNDSATETIRKAYKDYVGQMFRLYGFSVQEAQKRAQELFKQETLVALISKSMTELRDPQANYNKMTLAELRADYPHIPIEQWANAEGIDSKYLQHVVVGQTAFMAGLDKLMALQTVDELKALMEWDVITSSASYLTDEIREANFNFFGKTMSGRKEDYPLWKRATNQVDGQLGEALGRIYAKKYFPESSKKMMEQLVKNLQISLGERIDAQTWMSDSTKANAHKKLNKFYVKIGYPNKWTDYSRLTIDPRKSFYDNVMAVRKFNHDKEIAEKAGKPVDRDEWGMTPQTVNAYYNPTTNEICFPAGILQYPFFDPKADEAFNYGAIGVVIGHEMTHGFDDQGRQYDDEGNMRDWWTPADAKGFDQRADLYANFFDKIEVLPGLHANGRFTLGENLADHGGLQVAYHAFKNATAKKPLKNKDGFTPDQRFFLAYAGVWAGNITDQEIRNRVKRDPHSLGKWRVDGALPHIDAFYKAWNVKPGDKLYLPEAERLQLW